MSRDQLDKIKRYIKDDRPHKLRTYVRKHRLVLGEILLKHDRNLLHYCCKYGSGTVLKYLISEEVCGLRSDRNGDTPLHAALLRALNSEHSQNYSSTTDCYTDLVLPLIEKFPATLDSVNKAGETCRTLLHKLVKCRKRRDTANASSSSDITDSDSDSSDLEQDCYAEEVKWRDKLAAECEDEYYCNVGRFQQDFQDYTTEQETYDDWADRIRSEYHTKKQAQTCMYQRTRGSNKRLKSDHKPKTQAGPENLEEIRKKMREKFDKNSEQDKLLIILKRRMKYEKRYKETLERKEKTDLCYNDIPWPSVDLKACDDFTVLFEGMDKESGDFRKYFRDQQIRWHPDKFVQRFGDRLLLKDKDRIMERVTKLSQSLNKMSS